MRPVKLTFQGFTSFRKRQEIDFSQLELFAITGPVGAGKSSILDAMTLALYGKVARDLRAAELCNLGSKVLEVGLEFQVSQQSYYVYRKWDFHTKKAKPEFSLTQKIEGDWQPLGEPGQEAIDQTIKQILRMDFETFTRVILLPQGEFSKFLKGVARERRVILRQLVGYEIFEQMRSRAEDQKRTSRNQIDSLQSELANLQLYSPEELQGWKSQLQTLTQQEPQLSQELTQAQWDWEIEKNLLQQIQVFTQFQAQFVQHLQGEAEILNLQQKLEVAQSAERLETPWELLASTRIRQSEFAVKGQTLAIQVEQARQNFQRQTDSFQQFQQREQTQQATLKQQRLDLDDAIGLEAKLQLQKIEVERSQEQFQQKIQQLETKKQELQTVTEALQQLEQADQKADQALAKTSPGGAYLQQLEQVYPQLQKYSILCQQLVKDYQTLQGVLEELTQYQTQVIGATDHFQQAQRAHLQAEVQYQQAITQNQAAEIRSHLHQGENCPVCGGIYGSDQGMEPGSEWPETLDSADLKSLKKQLDAAHRQLQTTQSTQQQLQNQIEFLTRHQGDIEQNLTEQLAQETELEQQIYRVFKASIFREIPSQWPPKKVFEAKVQQLAELEQTYQQLRGADQSYQQALQAKQQTESHRDRQHQFQVILQQQFDQQQEEYDFLQEGLEASLSEKQQTEAQLQAKIGGVSYEEFKQSLAQIEQNLKQQREQFQAQHDESQQILQRLETRQEFHSQQLQNLNQQLEQYQLNWHQALAQAKITEAEFLEARVSPEQQKHWQSAIKKFGDRKLELQTQIQQKQSEIGNPMVTAATIEQAIAEKAQTIIQIQAQLKQAQSEIKQLEIQISQEESNQKSIQVKTQELEKINQEYQDYSTLALDLQSGNFQEYLLEEFQQELVASANTILWQLSEQRYILKYQHKKDSKKNNYEIEDHWNGGEQRAVNGLSGGETFAASLALALALSEKLAKGAQLDSLFIDEGFGTQDENSLEIVIQVLESLRQQQRLVGVISHVPALGERLGTELKVEKSPEGSQIRLEGLLSTSC